MVGRSGAVEWVRRAGGLPYLMPTLLAWWEEVVLLAGVILIGAVVGGRVKSCKWRKREEARETTVQ